MGLAQSVYNSAECANVRLIHNVANGPNVDVYLDGKKEVGSVAYQDITDYLKIMAGRHRIVIKASGSKKGEKALIACNVTVKRCKTYSLIVTGDVNNLRSLSVLPVLDEMESSDNKTNENGDNQEVIPMTYVRFIHAAAGAPEVDVWSRSVNGDVPVFEGYEYKDASKYKAVPAGDVTLLVAPAGTQDAVAVIGPLTLSLEADKNYTAIASGIVGDEKAPITALVAVDRSLYICLR